MFAILVFSLFLLYLSLAIHPFSTYPVTLLLAKKRIDLLSRGSTPKVNDQVDGPVGPEFSICVCAYNEAAVIKDKVENLLALRKITGAVEVLIYVDGGTDGTADILRGYDSEITLVVATERQGKTAGMNLLVGRATAPIIVFSDANVMMEMDSLINLRRYFADAQVGCVCGHLTYTNGSDSTTAEIGSAYWRLEEAIKQLECDTGSVMGADGSIFAIRRKLHRLVPPDIIDDFYVSMSILCDGYRVVRAPDVRATEKTVASSREEFRRKVRIACQSFNVHRLLWPRLRNQSWFVLYKYVSHKFLRWVVLFNLCLAGIFGLIWLGLVLGAVPAAVIASTGIGGFALACRLRFKPAIRVAEILSAFAATAVGVIRSLRGERFQTWTPAASIRSTPLNVSRVSVSQEFQQSGAGAGES